MKRRNDDDLSAFLIFLLVLCVFVTSFVTFVKPSSAALPRMEPLTATYTADDDVIKAYIITDPDTAIQYIVTDHGGITPRLHK